MMLIPLSIIFQSCLGSLAAYFTLLHGSGWIPMCALAISVCCCMSFNAAVLAQLKVEVVFKLLCISVASNIFVLIGALWI